MKHTVSIVLVVLLAQWKWVGRMGIIICPPNILEKQRMGQLFLKNIVTYEVVVTTQIIKGSTGFTRHTVLESAAFDLVHFGKQRLRSYK